MTKKHHAQRKKRLKLLLACSIAGLLSAASAPALRDGAPSQSGPPVAGTPQPDSHSSRPTPADQNHYLRSEHDFQTPDLILFDQRGTPVRLPDLLDNDVPVLMQFLFTTCTTICPVLSASFASAQTRLTAMEQNYRMVTISIDPEHDTPETLQQFAARFNAGSHWHLLTGPEPSIRRVLKAFDAHYPGNNKMYHQPYTYLRARRDTPWLKLDGLLSTADLVAEYRALLVQR